MKYYHVTLLSNLESILKDGLLPKVGERSMQARESKPAVYLFPSIEDMEDALMNWLGDLFIDFYGENTPLAVLEVNLPLGFPIKKGEVEYESISEVTIPPIYISFIREE